MNADDSSNRLSLEVVFEDEYMIEVECRVIIRDWSGVVSSYTTQQKLRDLAASAKQFGETHVPVAWEADEGNAIGSIGLQFYTIDRSGHIRCRVRLLRIPQPKTGLKEPGRSVWNYRPRRGR